MNRSAHTTCFVTLTSDKCWIYVDPGVVHLPQSPFCIRFLYILFTTINGVSAWDGWNNLEWSFNQQLIDKTKHSRLNYILINKFKQRNGLRSDGNLQKLKIWRSWLIERAREYPVQETMSINVPEQITTFTVCVNVTRMVEPRCGFCEMLVQPQSRTPVLSVFLWLWNVAGAISIRYIQTVKCKTRNVLGNFDGGWAASPSGLGVVEHRSGNPQLRTAIVLRHHSVIVACSGIKERHVVVIASESISAHINRLPINKFYLRKPYAWLMLCCDFDKGLTTRSVSYWTSSASGLVLGLLQINF